eukprot:7032968-Pyramimonas_sp.AAC.1
MLAAATAVRQAAGLLARNAICRAAPSSLASRAMISRSIARCVWRGDVRLARALLFQHPWTQDLIRVEGEVVSFVDP